VLFALKLLAEHGFLADPRCGDAIALNKPEPLSRGHKARVDVAVIVAANYEAGALLAAGFVELEHDAMGSRAYFRRWSRVMIGRWFAHMVPHRGVLRASVE
jgi:hypothetical protein